MTIRAINGGIRGIVYHCVRNGEAERLRDQLWELLDWGLLYQRPGGAGAMPGARAAPTAIYGEGPAEVEDALGGGRGHPQPPAVARR